LKVIPTCQWIYDRLAYNAGVSSSHRWTSLAPKQLANQLQEYLPDCEAIPVDTEELIDDIIDDAGFDFYSIAQVANQLVEDAKDDKAEPSLAVLGRGIEAWNVMHVVRIAQFHRNLLAVDPYPILNELEVVYENHPSAILVRAIGIKSNFLVRDPDYLERLGGALKEFEYKHPNRMSDYQILSQLHPLFEFAGGMKRLTATSMSGRGNEMPEYNYCREAAISLGAAYYMKILSRRSPLRMATLFTMDWENNKNDFEQWVQDYSESPATFLTAARVYQKHYKDTKKSIAFYEKYLEKFPDAAVLTELARMQFNQSDSDDWQKTLIRIFDTEDLGLQHSNTAAILAATLMQDGDYDAALEWAERANQSGSALGMLVLQQCLTGLDELDRASEMGRQNLGRYGQYDESAAYKWFMWCGANQHEDLDEAWLALQDAYKTHYSEQRSEELIAYNKTNYSLYKKDLKQLVANLKSFFKGASQLNKEYGALEVAIFSDQANDTKTRDEALERLIRETTKPSFSSELARLLQAYFKSGQYDHKQVLKLYKQFPEQDPANPNHLLILARLKHEGDELHGSIKQYLTKKLSSRILKPSAVVRHHLTLASLGEAPVYFMERVQAAAWVRAKPGEVAEEQRAREEKNQKYLDEQILRARKNDFQMKRFLEQKAARKEAEKEAATVE